MGNVNPYWGGQFHGAFLDSGGLRYNVRNLEFAAAGDGLEDDRDAFAKADAKGGQVAVGPGEYRFASSISLVSDVILYRGSKLVPDPGVVVTFVHRPHMFDEDEQLDTSEGGSFVVPPAPSQIDYEDLPTGTGTWDIGEDHTLSFPRPLYVGELHADILAAASVEGRVLDNMGMGKNVRIFGATGDGETDDALAFQAAAAAVGTTLIGPGTYRIGSNVTFEYAVRIGDNVSIIPDNGVIVEFQELVWVDDRVNVSNPGDDPFNTTQGGIFILPPVEFGYGVEVIGGLSVDRIEGPVYDLGGMGYNVRHPSFAGGAKGDGSTDDAPAFQAAAMVGGTVFIGPGVYRLASNVTFPSTVRIGDDVSLVPDEGVIVTFDENVWVDDFSPFDDSAGGAFVIPRPYLTNGLQIDGGLVVDNVDAETVDADQVTADTVTANTVTSTAIVATSDLVSPVAVLGRVDVGVTTSANDGVIARGRTDSALAIAGGHATTTGLVAKLYSQSHATTPSTLVIERNNVEVARIAEAMLIGTTSTTDTAAGGLRAMGDSRFDGNARILGDVIIGGSGATAIRRNTNNGFLRISGGSATNLGSVVQIYSESHTTTPNTIDIFQGSTHRMRISDRVLIGTTALGNSNAGGLLVNGSVVYNSYQEWRQNPFNLSTSTNNLDPTTSTVMNLNVTADINLTGIANGIAGRPLILANTGTNTITLKNADGGSIEGNQFVIGADIALAPGDGACLVYLGNRWRCVGMYQQ